MYKKFNVTNFFAFAIIVAGSLSFASCGDDNDIPTPPGEVTTEAMFGDYQGKMFTLAVVPQEGKENKPAGADVKAKVDKDTVYFEAFPIRDIVVSIVGEASADAIVKAVGDVKYKIGYKPTLNEAKDSISFEMKPETLLLTVPLAPQSTEEAASLNIEVKVSASHNGNYSVGSMDMAFQFNAEEVAIVNGEVKTPIEAFNPSTFDFKLTKTDKE